MSEFAREQARLLECSCAISRELINFHRSWHREYFNSQRQDPKLYAVGDRVFAKRAVKSDKIRGLVGKIMDAWTGPWEVTQKLKGSSYEIRHLDIN